MTAAPATATICSVTPDLIVLAPDRPEVALVVEVKAPPRNLEAVREQLKRYMLARKCPVALLVTPETTLILKDTYSDFTPDSVQSVGEVETAALLDQGGGLASARELERAVFDWLERLAASWSAALPRDPDAAKAVVDHLVPAVSEGRVTFGRAA